VAEIQTGDHFVDGDGHLGFETPEAAAEWARRQTKWEFGSELNFADGVTSVIALGADINAVEAWGEAWAERSGSLDEWDDVPGVHNWAIDLGLVTEPPS
jgi:hypothetical protein